MNIILLNKKIEEIQEIKTNTRLYNCLKRAGINEIKDIVFTERKKLEKIRNLGQNSKNALEKVLEKYEIELIGSEKFDDEISLYINQIFPAEQIKKFDEKIIDSNIDEKLKDKLITLGFETNIDLSTEEVKKYLTSIEYYKIKLYLISKNLITYEHPLYKYVVKQYEHDTKNPNNNYYIKKDISEIKKLQQVLIEDTNQNKKEIEQYKKELNKYITLKNENEEIKKQLEQLKEELKKAKVLQSSLENNKQKYDELRKEKEKLDNQLLEYFIKNKEKNNSK